MQPHTVNQRPHPISGPIAALLTPITSDGRFDARALERNIEFVLSRGIRGICVGGATGEYPYCGLDLRREVIQMAVALAGTSGTVVAGIGAGTLPHSLALAEAAAAAGASAVLLPPPFFFQYSQDDIAEFYRTAANATSLPVLIYNLPAFTTPVETATVLRLIDSVSSIVGLKDSSGNLEILTELRSIGSSAVRVVGHDGALAEAVADRLCDATISGIAGVLPELTIDVFNSADGAASRLAQLIRRLDAFPTPWGLKLIAECRGLISPQYAVPLSSARQAAATIFRNWFRDWWPCASSRLTT